MPEIQEYLPQTEAQGPVGGTSPNLELGGATGKALERLGGVLSENAERIDRRQAQEETTDIYASFAEKRANWTAKLQQQTQDGTLDVDKFTEEFDKDAEKDGEDLSTPEGKHFYERQKSRLRGSLLEMAVAGKAQLAAADAKGAWLQSMGHTSSALMQDPSSFQDAYESGVEAIDAMIKTGGLPEKMRDKAVAEMGAEYAKGAIRGWAEQNPANAKHMLDKGAFDDYLNADQKYQMQAEVHHYAAAQETEGRRADKAVEDAQKAAREAWGQHALPKLASNSLSTKDGLAAVKDGTLKWEQGERWLGLIDQGARKEFQSNPRVKNALIQKIVNPSQDDQNPIEGPEDLMKHVRPGELNISDFNQLNSLFNKTPEQQAAHQGEKALFDAAKKTIRYRDPLTNQYSVQGEQKLAKFMDDYIHAKNTIKAKGGSISDLVSPSSAMYFGNNLENYQTSMEDQLTHTAEAQKRKAVPPPTEPPDQYLERINKKRAADSPPTQQQKRAVDSAPSQQQEEPANPRAAKAQDDIGFMTDALGFTGPGAEAKEKEIAERKRKRKEYFK